MVHGVDWSSTAAGESLSALSGLVCWLVVVWLVGRPGPSTPICQRDTAWNLSVIRSCFGHVRIVRQRHVIQHGNIARKSANCALRHLGTFCLRDDVMKLCRTHKFIRSSTSYHSAGQLRL